MANEYSGTRLYLGNLHKDARKQEVEDFFKEHGSGKIVEIKLMNGFGFIQYDSEADAKDVVPAYHGRDFKGQALTVQFARGSRRDPRHHDFPGGADRTFPRPRRTAFRMNITGLNPDTSWQDLKDFARKSGSDVVFSEVSRDRDGRGMVEFETYDDLKRAVSSLDRTEFKGTQVACTPDVLPDHDVPRGHGPGRRSVSPRGYNGRRYSPNPSRGYHSPPRHSRRYESPSRGYRERTPPRGGRDPYYGGGGGGRDRTPPRRPPPPADDYPPPRSSGYGGRGDDYPPRNGGYDDDYRGANGSGRRHYDESHRGRPVSPPYRGRSPPRGPPPRGYDDYDGRRRY
ncbi:unnamed protein product [Tuber aestivum]|uniref:RRM domain-containing protein n=1 Tax=Tuber aestivum TaxID=59557 RepID=A0A292Q806_9PEZI|nr:unnamed protein product [Tuber aestivum]